MNKYFKLLAWVSAFYPLSLYQADFIMANSVGIFFIYGILFSVVSLIYLLNLRQFKAAFVVSISVFFYVLFISCVVALLGAILK